MLLLLDNYDSFTYNLYQCLSELGSEVRVVRNDRIDIQDIEELNPERIVISPGPSTPQNAGISNAVIRHYAGRLPLLGVCLGHQCIGHVFGALIRQAERIMHGKSSAVYHDGLGVFEGMPNPFSAMRYHSLLVDSETLPACLTVSARTEDGSIMGLRHRLFAVEGVQFHPESFMTESGRHLLANFLKIRVEG